MKITYEIFKIKRFGHDNPLLTAGNSVGYGTIIGEEWVYSSNSKLGALGVIDGWNEPAEFIIKEVYST